MGTESQSRCRSRRHQPSARGTNSPVFRIPRNFSNSDLITVNIMWVLTSFYQSFFPSIAIADRSYLSGNLAGEKCSCVDDKTCYTQALQFSPWVAWNPYPNVIRPYHLKKGQNPYWIRTIRTMWHVWMPHIPNTCHSPAQALLRILLLLLLSNQPLDTSTQHIRGSGDEL